MHRAALAIACSLTLLVSLPMGGRSQVHAAQAPARLAGPAPLHLVQAGDAPSSAHRGGSVVQLASTSMSAVRGEGWWRRFINFMKCRVVTYMVPGGPWRRECEGPTTNVEVVSATHATDRSDYFTEQAQTTDTLNEDGSLVSSEYSTTGPVFDYSVDSGT